MTPETQILVDNGPNNKNIFPVIFKKVLKDKYLKIFLRNCIKFNRPIRFNHMFL